MRRPTARLVVATILLLGSLLLLSGDAAAQVPPPSDAARAAPADSAAHLPPGAPRSGWLYILPVVAYSPETKLVLGASAGRYYRLSDDPDSRPTTSAPLALITTNNQIILSMFTDAWWSGDRWHLANELGYSKFPTQFFGVGDHTPPDAEEDYTPRTTYFGLETTRRTTGALYLGVLLDAKYTSMNDFVEGGLLDSGEVFGSEGGALWGFGLSASWDSRDAIFYPTRGWLSRVAVTRYLDVLGGDYVYTWTDASVSRYWAAGSRLVVAANVSGGFISGGQAPFYQLNRLMLRGYFEERYLDNHVIRGRLELRARVWGPVGAVVFGGAGEMASSLDRLRLDEARPAVGLGVRYNLGGEQTANIRLDYGWGDGDHGFYIRFGEAF
jgi:outer membrane protein assembly factor BamA